MINQEHNRNWQFWTKLSKAPYLHDSKFIQHKNWMKPYDHGHQTKVEYISNWYISNSTWWDLSLLFVPKTHKLKTKKIIEKPYIFRKSTCLRHVAFDQWRAPPWRTQSCTIARINHALETGQLLKFVTDIIMHLNNSSAIRRLQPYFLYNNELITKLVISEMLCRWKQNEYLHRRTRLIQMCARLYDSVQWEDVIIKLRSGKLITNILKKCRLKSKLFRFYLFRYTFKF